MYHCYHFLCIIAAENCVVLFTDHTYQSLPEAIPRARTFPPKNLMNLLNESARSYTFLPILNNCLNRAF